MGIKETAGAVPAHSRCSINGGCGYEGAGYASNLEVQRKRFSLGYPCEFLQSRSIKRGFREELAFEDLRERVGICQAKVGEVVQPEGRARAELLV